MSRVRVLSLRATPRAASLTIQVPNRSRPVAGEASTAEPPASLGFLGRPAPAFRLPPVFSQARARRSGEAMPETIDLPLVPVRRAVAAAVRTPFTSLPFAARIQRSFGDFDLHGVRAHLGGEAAASARTLGARAYATGDHVVFASRPDLFTAAHEAAHVIQQRAGARPTGGIDRPGDSQERHADAVAEQVVAGRPAERLLAAFAERPDGDSRRAPQPPPSSAPVQRRVGLEIESLIPVHEVQEDGPGKSVPAGRQIATYADLRLVVDHAGQFRDFPGGSGIVEYQTPPRSDTEPQKILEDVDMAAGLTESIIKGLKTGFETAMEVEGKKSSVDKPSLIGDEPNDTLELGLKGATQAQIDAIDGSGRFQINIGVPASAVMDVFRVGAGPLLRGEQSTKAVGVYNLAAQTTQGAAKIAQSLGITPQKNRVDFNRTSGFLILLLQHLVAPKLVPTGERETEKQHFAFLPKTPLHLIFNTLPKEIRELLAANGEMILKAVAPLGVGPETQLFEGPTAAEAVAQILAGATDPVVESVFEGKPLGLEEAGESKEAPVLETRHIRGPQIPPAEWLATAKDLLGHLLPAIAGKT